jgi:hypothetical protein
MALHDSIPSSMRNASPQRAPRTNTAMVIRGDELPGSRVRRGNATPLVTTAATITSAAIGTTMATSDDPPSRAAPTDTPARSTPSENIAWTLPINRIPPRDS